jgi:L-fucose mutarotase
VPGVQPALTLRHALTMLRSPILHPPLLAALGAAGHGARVLIADANYSHSTNISPQATLIHLNLRPGLVTVDQVLEPVLELIPVEAVTLMQPDDRSTPPVWALYTELFNALLPAGGYALQIASRLTFYEACRQPDLAVCVATGDTRLYANVLLTVGYLKPS